MYPLDVSLCQWPITSEENIYLRTSWPWCVFSPNLGRSYQSHINLTPEIFLTCSRWAQAIIIEWGNLRRYWVVWKREPRWVRKLEARFLVTLRLTREASICVEENWSCYLISSNTLLIVFHAEPEAPKPEHHWRGSLMPNSYQTFLLPAFQLLGMTGSSL